MKFLPIMDRLKSQVHFKFQTVLYLNHFSNFSFDLYFQTSDSAGLADAHGALTTFRGRVDGH